MGSSRALHHYDPDIITNITLKSCYNAGFDGNGILLNYPLLDEIIKRYSPQLIIYDLADGFDLLERDDNHKFISVAKPFYGKYPELKNVFEDVDWLENYKMLSNMYQYNSNWFNILSGFLPHNDGKSNGYDPRSGTIADDHFFPAVNSDGDFDDVKMKYMYKFIAKCKEKGVSLVFVMSPFYYKRESDVVDEFKHYCSIHHIPFWDYSDIYLGNNSLFYDGSHMNEKGASRFSEIIGNRIKDI